MDSRKILKIKRYSNFLQYTYYDLDDSKCLITYTNNNNNKSNDFKSSESLRCSISRSISNIKEYCFCNDFEFFVTFTLKDKNRNSILFACNTISSAIKKYGKTRKDFKYLYVFEKTKKGGIHAHGFFSGFDDLYLNLYGHWSSKFFDSIGFHNIIPMYKVNPFYIIKYISKEPIKELKHRYFRSRNLKKAEISYLKCNFDEFKNFYFTFKNKYCKMITIEI